MKRSFANKTLIVFSLIAMIAIIVIVGLKFSNKIAPETKEVDGQKIMDIVLDLTDEKQFPHRNVSLPGNHDAALYIAEAFEAYGLVSHEETPNYLQYYDGQKANVIGIIPGNDETLKDETIVIGGHFDTKAVFNGLEIVHEPGAADNASGTAVMMEVARVMADAKPARTLIFVAFNEEEAGYVGSAYMAEHPLDGVDPIAMINMDMVGSLLDNPIYICTVGHGDSPYPMEDALIACAEKLNLEVSTAAVGRTDHRSFAARGIPAIELYSYDNRFYHTAEDTPDKLDAVHLEEVGQLVVQWLFEAAN
jgi:Zn-dependent M28 family amino/carboxypeptidase